MHERGSLPSTARRVKKMGVQTRSRNAARWRTAWIGRSVNIVILLVMSTGGGRRGGLHCADARCSLSEHDESVVGGPLPRSAANINIKTPRLKLSVESGEKSPGVKAAGHEILVRRGRVPKTVFSDKVRVLALVGVEGSGHHYLLTAISNMFETSKIKDLPSAIRYHSLASVSMTAAAQKSLREDMRAIVDAERLMEAPGTIVSINIPSYPTGNAGDKVLSYIDLRLVAEMAEEEGIDLRVIYLQRPARNVLLSNITHRHFPDFMRFSDTRTPKERVDYYLRSLFADLGVVDSMLRELDPAFIVCLQYNEMQDVEQATRVGDFVSPTTEVARFFTEALLSTAHLSSADEELDVAEADLVVERFQKKFDSFEPLYCGTGNARF